MWKWRMTLDLEALKKVAEAATPGLNNNGDTAYAFTKMFHPQTALALIQRIQELEGENLTLKHITQYHCCKILIEPLESQLSRYKNGAKKVKRILQTNDNAGLACYRIKDEIDAILEGK